MERRVGEAAAGGEVSNATVVLFREMRVVVVVVVVGVVAVDVVVVVVAVEVEVVDSRRCRGTVANYLAATLGHTGRSWSVVHLW